MDITMNCFERAFTIKADDNVRSVNISPINSADGIQLFKINAVFQNGAAPAPISITWHEYMLDTVSFWSPLTARDHAMYQWYRKCVVNSCLYYGAPVFSVYAHGGENRYTVALSEAEKPVRLSVAVNDFDEKEELDFNVILFENTAPGTDQFSCVLRIDTRRIEYTEAVADTAQWWQGYYPAMHASAEQGERPLYSNWYDFHQNPRQIPMEAELDAAAEMGFTSMIIDDGWSYDGPGSGDYRDCGIWEVVKSKFPDFQEFMNHAHKNGIKVALWFPMPFIGINDPNYAYYKDKSLYFSEFFQASILDPRIKEVRDYIISGYRNMVTKYGLDGLKLDFIDSFRCSDPLKRNDIDCATIEEAVERLLSEIEAEFCSKDPEFLIEFRQHYEGPSIIRHCNMLRVGDCPFDVLTNRVGMVDLRIYNYPLAVHADMFFWAHHEEPSTCARMLINTLFEVPQISVMLHKAPKEQLDVIRAYTRYWDAHRSLLLHARIHVTDPECNYTTVSAVENDLRITAVYADKPLRCNMPKEHIFNATVIPALIINAEKNYTASIYNCFGACIETCCIKAGLNSLGIPAGGHAELCVQ